MFEVGTKLKFVGDDGKYEDDTVYTVATVDSDGGFSVEWVRSSGSAQSASYTQNGKRLFRVIDDSEGWLSMTDEERAVLDKFGIEYETRTVTQYRIKGGK